MIRIDAVIAGVPNLDESRICDWAARGWVQLEGAGPDEWLFTEVDVARLCLLHELLVDLAVDEETVPLVLSLLDQVYSLRRALRTVLDVVNKAPEHADLQRRIVAALTPEA